MTRNKTERKGYFHPGGEQRNIDTKARVVEILQGQSSTEQGCFQSGTRPLPDTPVWSPTGKKI